MAKALRKLPQSFLSIDRKRKQVSSICSRISIFNLLGLKQSSNNICHLVIEVLFRMYLLAIRLSSISYEKRYDSSVAVLISHAFWRGLISHNFFETSSYVHIAILEFECLLSTSRATFERNKLGAIPMDALMPVFT